MLEDLTPTLQLRVMNRMYRATAYEGVGAWSARKTIDGWLYQYTKIVKEVLAEDAYLNYLNLDNKELSDESN